MKIRVAVGQFHDLTDERLRFAAQIGATGLQMNNPTLPGDARWEEKDVRALVEKVEAAGLKFEAIENVPTHFYHQAMMGLDGRDEQIENYRHTIRAVARAGIHVLGYHFMPNSVWTTERNAPTRGGAVARQFDMTVVEANADNLELLRSFMPTTLGRASSMPLFGKDGPVITEDQMWANYEYFIKAVLPVAEEEGLRLALHPDDPPVPMLGGVARLFYKPDNFRKAYTIAGSSASWALDLCLGCCSEMPGGKENVREMIEYFAPKGAIATSTSATSGARCRTSPNASSATATTTLPSAGAAREERLTASCSTTMCPRWTATATGTTAAAPMPSATCGADPHGGYLGVWGLRCRPCPRGTLPQPRRRMQDGAVAGAERVYRRGWREQAVDRARPLGRRIAARAPSEPRAAGNEERFRARRDHRAVRQRGGQGMEPLAAAVESLAMQRHVHLARLRRRNAVPLGPRAGEGDGGLPPAFEAGPMAGGERRRFVEEEQFRP